VLLWAWRTWEAGTFLHVSLWRCAPRRGRRRRRPSLRFAGGWARAFLRRLPDERGIICAFVAPWFDSRFPGIFRAFSVLPLTTSPGRYSPFWAAPYLCLTHCLFMDGHSSLLPHVQGSGRQDEGRTNTHRHQHLARWCRSFLCLCVADKRKGGSSAMPLLCRWRGRRCCWRGVGRSALLMLHKTVRSIPTRLSGCLCACSTAGG